MYLIISFIAEVQAICLLAVHAIGGLFKNPRYTRDHFQQMDDIGVKSTGLAMLTGLFTGGVLALQSVSSLKAFGAVNLTGQLVSVALVVELGPVLTALMLAGRVGRYYRRGSYRSAFASISAIIPFSLVSSAYLRYCPFVLRI